MTIESVLLFLGFLLSVFAMIASGISAYYVGKQGLTGDAIKMYEQQKEVTKEQNAKIDKLTTKVNEQERKIELLIREVETMKQENDTLAHKLALADARIIELEEENVTIREQQKHLRKRFVAMRDLLVHTHEVALVLVDQLINEQNVQPKQYPPDISEFLGDAGNAV